MRLTWTEISGGSQLTTLYLDITCEQCKLLLRESSPISDCLDLFCPFWARSRGGWWGNFPFWASAPTNQAVSTKKHLSRALLEAKGQEPDWHSRPPRAEIHDESIQPGTYVAQFEEFSSLSLPVKSALVSLLRLLSLALHTARSFPKDVHY